jgi:hypothetical protein
MPPTVEELVNLAQDVHARLRRTPSPAERCSANLLGDGMMKLSGVYALSVAAIVFVLKLQVDNPHDGDVAFISIAAIG